MKTTATLFFIFWLSISSKAQSTSAALQSLPVRECTLNYLDGQWQFSHRENGPHKCSELHIENLPEPSKKITPINLDLIVKGVYYLKRSDHLNLSEGYTYTIEDQLTGVTYDLASSTAFQFSFNRSTSDARFLLNISKVKTQETKGSLSVVTQEEKGHKRAEQLKALTGKACYCVPFL